MFKKGDKVITGAWGNPMTITSVVHAFGTTFYECISDNGIKLTTNGIGLKLFHEPVDTTHKCSNFKQYIGFTEHYTYCTDCDRKLVN